jgi:hypothetical protein
MTKQLSASLGWFDPDEPEPVYKPFRLRATFWFTGPMIMLPCAAVILFLAAVFK